MGCGVYKNVLEEVVGKPWDNTLHEIPHAEVKGREFINLNRLYKEAQLLLEIIEDIRYTVFDKFDELVLNSGACLLESPDIAACLRCVFWKVSSDNKGNINRASIKCLDTDPYFEIKNKNYDSSTELILNELIFYISESYSISNRLRRVDLEIPQLVYILAEKNVQIFFKNKILESTDHETRHLIQSNNSKIEKAINKFNLLEKEVPKIIRKFQNEMQKLRNDSQYKREIDQVGGEAYKKGITDIHQIVSHCYTGKKLSINEGVEDYKELIEAKKELRKKFNS